MILDRIYFSIFDLYKKRFKSDIPEVYSICFISVLTFFHIGVVFFILKNNFVEFDSLKINKIHSVGTLLVLMALYALRYLFVLKDKDVKVKHIKSRYILAYFFITLALLVFLMTNR